MTSSADDFRNPNIHLSSDNLARMITRNINTPSFFDKIKFLCKEYNMYFAFIITNENLLYEKSS